MGNNNKKNKGKNNNKNNKNKAKEQQKKHKNDQITEQQHDKHKNNVITKIANHKTKKKEDEFTTYSGPNWQYEFERLLRNEDEWNDNIVDHLISLSANNMSNINIINTINIK